MYAVVIPNHIIAHTRWQKTRLEYDADAWYMDKPFPAPPPAPNNSGRTRDGSWRSGTGRRECDAREENGHEGRGLPAQGGTVLLLLPVVLAAFALPSADFVLLAALFWTLYFYQKEQP